MYRTSAEWVREYEKRNGLWMHDGNPRRPHALLTSGLHSNGFFNSRKIIPQEKEDTPEQFEAKKELLREAACDLLERYVQQGGELRNIEGVIGPATGATLLSNLISWRVSAHTLQGCVWASPTKQVGDDGADSMVLTAEEARRIKGKHIAVCEDVTTTGKSVLLALKPATDAGARSLNVLLTLVNRSGQKAIDRLRIVSLIDRHLPAWPAHECPLCAQGSEALPAKDNWARLNAH